MKRLMIGLALTAMIATPTLAQTYSADARMANTHMRGTYSQGYDAYASADRGFVANGPVLYAGGQYLGWDPDPAIRADLLRQGIPAGN